MAKNTVSHVHVEFPQLLPVANQLLFCSKMLHRMSQIRRDKHGGAILYPPDTPIQHIRALKHIVQLMQAQNLLTDYLVLRNMIFYDFSEVQPEKPHRSFLFKGEPL